MFFTISRLGLALGAPALIAAQSLTTYAVTISNSVHEIVLPTPRVTTVTEYMTNPGATTTIIPPASIETYIFTVTGPPPEVTSIVNNIPSGARVLGDLSSESPGAIVPIVVHGFTTSIQIPATVSIPTGSATIAPVNIVAPTPAVIPSAASAVSAIVSQASSAASQEAVVASNVAGSATTPASIVQLAGSSGAPVATMAISNAASAATGPLSAAVSAATVVNSPLTTQDGIPTHVPIPIIPLLSISASIQSASSVASNALSSIPSTASNAISSATVTNAISSAAVALSSLASHTSVATAILSDTTIASTTETVPTTSTTGTGIVTKTSSVQTTMTTTTSSSVAATTSGAPSSSSSAPPVSSTAAPPANGAGRVMRRGGVGVFVGVVVALVMG